MTWCTICLFWYQELILRNSHGASWVCLHQDLEHSSRINWQIQPHLTHLQWMGLFQNSPRMLRPATGWLIGKWYSLQMSQQIGLLWSSHNSRALEPLMASDSFRSNHWRLWYWIHGWTSCPKSATSPLVTLHDHHRLVGGQICRSWYWLEIHYQALPAQVSFFHERLYWKIAKIQTCQTHAQLFPFLSSTTLVLNTWVDVMTTICNKPFSNITTSPQIGRGPNLRVLISTRHTLTSTLSASAVFPWNFILKKFC